VLLPACVPTWMKINFAFFFSSFAVRLPQVFGASVMRTRPALPPASTLTMPPLARSTTFETESCASIRWPMIVPFTVAGPVPDLRRHKR